MYWDNKHLITVFILKNWSQNYKGRFHIQQEWIIEKSCRDAKIFWKEKGKTNFLSTRQKRACLNSKTSKAISMFLHQTNKEFF